jgi:hypothetical protein
MQYRPVRRVITDLLETLQAAYIEPAEVDPPPLEALRHARLPVVDEETVRKQIEHLSLRRHLLHGFLNSDGVRWSQLQRFRENYSSISSSERHVPM